MIYNVTLNDYGNVCGSCTMHTVLLLTVFLILIGISSVLFIGT